jgi:succinate dehydrogenase / fumarate reductase iron-sulfur subunit
MSHGTMNLTLRIWRQKGPEDKGGFRTYRLEGVSEHQSFLEMLDQLNDELLKKGEEPVAFDSDCREGICGTCGCMVDGKAHGPDRGITCCQLHMRRFKDGDTITIEPFRAKAFPVVKDLIVDRRALDRIILAGGFVSVNTGQAPDAHAIPVPKYAAEKAMDAAACIGCGACVAACKNASAMLFTSAKVAQLSYLPQGHPERKRRALKMLLAHDALGFGACTNEGECETSCPKQISVRNISLLNREYARGALKREVMSAMGGGA